jgi:hypothetical protein
MNEQEVRAIVRAAIARQAAAGPRAGGTPVPPPAFVSAGGHASHALFSLPSGLDSEGPCIIEPAVTCNHCGYCKSYGH